MGGSPVTTKHGQRPFLCRRTKNRFAAIAYLVVDQVNPGLVDLFTRQARKSVQEKEKGSVLQKLKQELPAHKPAAPKKQGPER